MARRTNNGNEPRTLIPIDEVALVVGLAHVPEAVWKKLAPEEVFLNWRYAHCVEPHTARRVLDEVTAANEEAVEIQRRRDEEHQRELDAENERLRAEGAERAALQRQRVIDGGISVQTPGEPEPPWAREEDE
jgi:sRNA-binding protein